MNELIVIPNTVDTAAQKQDSNLIGNEQEGRSSCTVVPLGT